MKNRYIKNIEWSILGCCIILLLIGMVALYSATQDDGNSELKKQIVWSLISIPVTGAVLIVDYKTISKISPLLYGAFIITLIAVLFTTPVNGATSWFKINDWITFQPSEFAKVVFVIFMAFIITKLQNGDKREINRFWKLLITGIIFLIPAGLIVLQPDYGTLMAFVMAYVFMIFIAGIDKKFIIFAIILVVIGVPLAYKYVLPEHAKTRIDVFLNPELDPRGSGYNVIQSKLAIGSGELLGMGLLKGNQTQLGYLYPKTTDFIFSVIGEEMGFIVAASVIILYVVLITKSVYVAKTARDDIGAYIAIGICGIFTFHMLENIGMTMGLLPITGVPLPFVSYGGSSLITNFICIALLLNISGRRQKSMFIE
jgi:rod shape determining protein RodA